MTERLWGLLGPEKLATTRRTRTLDLGRVVRRFNERAVPGTGGLWFGRQAYLTALSVVVAERVTVRGQRCSNIEMANAIEAVACMIGYASNGRAADPRLRGRNKLPAGGAPSFAVARQRGFHVAQPMRMSTAQALPSLGLAHAAGSRFNAFSSSDAAVAFIDACADGAKVGRNNSVVEHLEYWADGSGLSLGSGGLRAALDPTRPLPVSACKLLQRALEEGGSLDPADRARRQNAWRWVARLQQSASAADRIDHHAGPAELEADHWHDVRAGAYLFRVRDAANAVLDCVEGILATRQGKTRLPLDGPLHKDVAVHLAQLAGHARAFLALGHGDDEANRFSRECEAGDADTLRALLRRDDHVLRLLDDGAQPGPAYTGHPPALSQDNGDPQEETGLGAYVTSLPDGCSYRLRNLYLLHMDVHGLLGPKIDASRVAGAGASA